MPLTRRSLLGFTLASLTVLSACGEKDEDPDSGLSDSGSSGDGQGGAPAEPDPDTLRAATFNTGLALVVKGAAERLPLIVEEVKKSDPDVLCLQELFSPTSPEAFAAEVSESYPHSYYSELGESFLGNGLLLLSRFPLSSGEALLFDAADPDGFTDRMVIAADLEIGESSVHVLCSHLIAGLDEDGASLRAAQVEELTEFAAASGDLAEPTLLLGDFNLGPDPVLECTPTSDPACLAPDEENYELLLETFEDPNENWDQCTQCREVFLPLQTLDLYADEPDQRIDHCLTSGFEAWSFESASTVFSDPISLEFGDEELTSLSDHLGLSCEFRRVL